MDVLELLVHVELAQVGVGGVAFCPDSGEIPVAFVHKFGARGGVAVREVNAVGDRAVIVRAGNCARVNPPSIAGHRNFAVAPALGNRSVSELPHNGADVC